MSGITAIVLTTGEDTTVKAIDSLKKQTLVPDQIIVVEYISPFHKAINYGASRVQTKFFVQVDADMILNENCLESLMSCMDKKTGISIGYLEDEIAGMVNGVRLVRTDCFRKNNYGDSINPESRFIIDTLNDGWVVRYALNCGTYKNGNKYPNSLGYHKPSCSPLYTYSRYFFLGGKLNHRKDLIYLKLWIDNLFNNDHEYSIFAKLGLSNGLFFCYENHDIHTPDLYRNDTEDYNIVKKFLATDDYIESGKIDMGIVPGSSGEDTFRRFYELGSSISKIGSKKSLIDYLKLLRSCGHENSWMARIAMCRGIISSNPCDELDNDLKTVNEFC